MKTTGIVICNYNKCDYVVKCIQSVLESATKDYDLYVVDNASEDGSPERIKEMFGDSLYLIENDENLGGSGGFNTGIRKVVSAGYKYVWCLDNDVLVDENALGSLVEFLDTHDDTGMVGSKVYHMENPDYVQQFGITIDFDEFCVEAKYLNHVEDGTMPDIVYSDAVAACSVLVRTSLIRKIGYMPETNFLYWDDTEWGYRCNAAGYKVASYGKSKVLHAMGAKKESVNTFPTYYAWRNWINFYIRFTPEEKLEKMAETFIGSVFDILYGGYYRGEFNKVKTVMCAYDDALHGVGGKAGNGKILQLDFNESHLADTIKNKKTIRIDVNGHDALLDTLKQKINKYSPGAVIITDGDGGEKPDVCIRLCSYIFLLRLIDEDIVYIDEDLNVLAGKGDEKKVKNYGISRQAFIFGQKPLFMMLAQKLRHRTAKESES